jgi:glucuronate isomerase
MAPFLGEDFLLNSESARHLFHEYAAPQPIFDYHTHLSASDIAADRPFNDLYEIWLAGDHYKWRAMRANGIGEQYCTGDAPEMKKLMRWAMTVSALVGNPLYHWTHLELQRYFGIDELFNTHTAPGILHRANTILKDGLTTRAILQKFKVHAVFTTDDPVDDLSAHETLAEQFQQGTFNVAVRPTFRPDRAFRVTEPEIFLPWLKSLQQASNIEIRDFAAFQEALQSRHRYFKEVGCCASDHGLERCPARPCTEAAAGAIFARALSRQPISPEEAEQYSTFLLILLARLNTEANWVMQLHLGPLRNPSSTAFVRLGPDTGFDTIGDFRQGLALARFLDLLQRENALPRTILYNSNPSDNAVFAAIANSFHATVTPTQTYTGALQWGPPWWFLDQKQGITDHLNTLASLGVLSRFVGMTTDSRSFMSFPRHEYFRRILCDLLGTQIEHGELPDDLKFVGDLVKKLCFNNAQAYFKVFDRRVLVYPT